MKRNFYTIIFLILATNLFAITNSEKTSDNINISGVNKIAISSDVGDITVVPEGRDDIYVELLTYKNGPKLIVEKGNKVKIEAKMPRFRWFGVKKEKVELKVFIPQNYNGNLDIHSSSGDIMFSDMDVDDLYIQLSSGDLVLNDVVTNKSKIGASSGDITINNSNMSFLDIHLSSGKLVIDNFEGEIEGRSSSGDVDIQLNKLTAPINYHLSSGDFELQISQSEISANLDLKTSSGEIEIDFPILMKSSKKRHAISGTVGDGQHLIKVSCSSGDIFIR